MLSIILCLPNVLHLWKICTCGARHLLRSFVHILRGLFLQDVTCREQLSETRFCVEFCSGTCNIICKKAHLDVLEVTIGVSTTRYIFSQIVKAVVRHQNIQTRAF